MRCCCLQNFWALFLRALEGLSKQRQFLCFYQASSRQRVSKAASRGFFLGSRLFRVGLTSCSVLCFSLPLQLYQASEKFLFPDDSASSVNIHRSDTVSDADTKWKIVASPASTTQLDRYKTYWRQRWVFKLRWSASPFKTLADLLRSLKLMWTLHCVSDHMVNLIWFLRSCNKDLSVSNLCTQTASLFLISDFYFPCQDPCLHFNAHKSYWCNKTISFTVKSLKGSARSYLQQCKHIRSCSWGVAPFS